TSNALAIATALSQANGNTLPWKTVKDVISGAIQARFIAVEDGSAAWPCEMSSAKTVKFVMPEPTSAHGSNGGGGGGGQPDRVAEIPSNKRSGRAELEPSEVQDLADVIPQLLELKNKYNTPIQFSIRIECGDGTDQPKIELINEINKILLQIKDGLKIE
ncbi:MAG: hypothetical protein Q8M16_01685, partial [Pirellulaceae bacterium]|nr:hypothetical protein [Pirellulaceae bacterium]